VIFDGAGNGRVFVFEIAGEELEVHIHVKDAVDAPDCGCCCFCTRKDSELLVCAVKCFDVVSEQLNDQEAVPTYDPLVLYISLPSSILSPNSTQQSP
jgi:hypothetical protein